MLIEKKLLLGIRDIISLNKSQGLMHCSIYYPECVMQLTPMVKVYILSDAVATHRTL